MAAGLKSGQSGARRLSFSFSESSVRGTISENPETRLTIRDTFLYNLRHKRRAVCAVPGRAYALSNPRRMLDRLRRGRPFGRPRTQSYDQRGRFAASESA